MKVLVTGVTGQLGYDICRILEHNDIDYLGASRSDFDISDAESVAKYIREYRPDWVIHCAAYTAVDKAEDDKDNCASANIDGTYNIVMACKEINAGLVYFSSDYVYGSNGTNYIEVNDTVRPINYYGYTKLKGEEIVETYLKEFYILRISWVFGINGNNFVKTMINLGTTRDCISVVNDQVGAPTYTVDLAKLVYQMINTNKYGIYNVSNEGECSWYEFAKEIFKQAGLNCNVQPISSVEYKTKAIRPTNSRMSKEKLELLGFAKLPLWQDALIRYLSEMRGRQLL